MAPTFYVEAQLDPAHDITLVEANSDISKVFEDGYIPDLRLNQDLCESDIRRPCFPPYVTSIKAVQYTASSDVAIFHETKDARIIINSYRLREDDDEVDLPDELSSCYPRLLPQAEFEDAWERLIFDCDIKGSLVKLATSSLRISSSSLNRLFLLTGPPGTGKSTLAQALAQKLSIRLNTEFSETFLLHLRPAALLSQFFGQSAKKIDEIFDSVAHLSTKHPQIFYVLVIDEIESLAGSRSQANAQGEVQDAIRATNQLLRGFDTIKNRRNILIIGTTNLLESLDKAFISRCSAKFVVPPPRASARYEILRYGLQMLVDEDMILISEHDSLPRYEDAVTSVESEFGTAGVCLCVLVNSLDRPRDEEQISARWLGQLPELALGTYLDADATCTLSEAVDMMSRYVESMKTENENGTAVNGSMESGQNSPANQSQQRKLEEDYHDERTCACCCKRGKLVGTARTGDTDAIKDTIHKISSQIGPVIEQLVKVISEEVWTALAAKQSHEDEARPLEEIDEASLNSRPKKRQRSKMGRAGAKYRLMAGTSRQQLAQTDELPSEQMMLDENPWHPSQQVKVTGNPEQMMLGHNSWPPSQQGEGTGDLLDKLETLPRHGEQARH